MTENVDTYVTTTEADQIISETYPPASPLSVSWVVLTETEKERFLAVALERMENLAYKGDRAYYFQSLQFPRIARGIPANFHDAPIEVNGRRPCGRRRSCGKNYTSSAETPMRVWRSASSQKTIRANCPWAVFRPRPRG